MAAETRALAAAALLLAGPAAAGDTPPPFGRNLPMYPAYYYSVAWLQDDRDASFDQSGGEHASAVPTVPGNTAFPETRYEAVFSSYFPVFEDAGIPFISSRVHVARLKLRYGDSRTDGALGAFIDSNPEFAPRSEGGDRGVGDVGVEFGTFLLGGGDWRTRKDTPFALLLLGALDAPVGSYEQTSPVTPGSNRVAWGLSLGAHWRPWRGGFVEGGGGFRAYNDNHNAHFGRLSPTAQGDDVLWNASLTQRLFRGAYLGVFFAGREGEANEYRNPRYAPNPPTPNPAPQGGTTESFPIPGIYRDDGTALRTAGLSFGYFVTQRLMASVDWSHPLAGRSGQPAVRFRQRQCQPGSAPGSGGCTESDFPEPTVVDGQGSARSFASDSLRLSVSYNFGHADPFTCTGCSR